MCTDNINIHCGFIDISTKQEFNQNCILLWEWGDHSIGKVLAIQAREPEFSAQNPSTESRCGSWREDSAVKILQHSCRKAEISSQHPSQVALGDPAPSSCLWRHCAHVQTPTHRRTHIHIIFENFKFLKSWHLQRAWASKCPSNCIPGTCTGAGEPPQFQQPTTSFIILFLVFYCLGNMN